MTPTSSTLLRRVAGAATLLLVACAADEPTQDAIESESPPGTGVDDGAEASTSGRLDSSAPASAAGDTATLDALAEIDAELSMLGSNMAEIPTRLGADLRAGQSLTTDHLILFEGYEQALGQRLRGWPDAVPGHEVEATELRDALESWSDAASEAVDDLAAGRELDESELAELVANYDDAQLTFQERCLEFDTAIGGAGLDCTSTFLSESGAQFTIETLIATAGEPLEWTSDGVAVTLTPRSDVPYTADDGVLQLSNGILVFSDPTPPLIAELFDTSIGDSVDGVEVVGAGENDWTGSVRPYIDVAASGGGADVQPIPAYPSLLSPFETWRLVEVDSGRTDSTALALLVVPVLDGPVEADAIEERAAQVLDGTELVVEVG